MINFFYKIFKKEESLCEHGYPNGDENTIPHKRFNCRIEACKECAIDSSLKEMGSGIILTQEQADQLREKLDKIRNQ